MNSLVKKIFILIIFVSAILIFNSVFSYDDKTTHPALTDEIVDFYNLNFPDNPLTAEEKEWIVQGSIDEDTPPRWINHFYDPIYQNGWSGEKTGIWSQSLIQYFSKFGLSNEQPVSSLNWLHNQKLQAKYGQYKGNRTWERTIYELAKNKNKKEAYYTLGFILHLIEDATVPDHTRNDTHAHELQYLTGDYGSPYEEYLKKYKRDNLNIAQNLFNQKEKPIILNSIDDYLISLAQYSNKYFFSKDTINDQKYQYPKIIEEDGIYGYGKDENDVEFPLVKVEYKYILKGGQFKKIRNYYLPYELKNSIILNAYFSRLSRKAVLAGAGIIKLFKEEVAKAEKENLPEPIKDSASIWSLTGKIYKIKNSISQIYNQTKENVSSIVSIIFSNQSIGQSNNQSFFDTNTSNTNTNQAVFNASNKNQSSQVSDLEKQIATQSLNSETQNLNLPIPESETVSKNTENPALTNSQIIQESINTEQIQNQTKTNQITNSQNINLSPSYSAPILILAGPDITNSQTNTNSGANNTNQEQNQNNENQNQELNQENQENEESQQEPTSTPSFLETPTILTNNAKDFITASSTIILEGTKPENSEIFINDSNENINYPTSTIWQKEIALNPDENIFVVQAKNNETESATTSIKITFDNSGPNQITDLTGNPGEKIGQIILTFSKPTDNYTDISKYLIKINDGVSETEHEFLSNNATSTKQESYLFENLNPEQTYEFEVFSFDEFNQKSKASNQISIQPQTKTNHLVINQVQIQKKEFVELYNPTTETIDLNNFYLAIYSKNDNWHEPNNLRQFPENSKISSNGYYLIGFYGASSSTVDWQPYESYQLNNKDGAIAIFSANPKEILTATSTPEEIDSIKIDAFGWGSPKVFEANPKSEIAQDYQSFKRKFLAFDTDNNQNNFVISDPTPTNSKNQTFKEKIKWVLELNNQNEINDSFAYSILSPNKTLYVYAINNLFAVDINGNLKWKKKINSQNFVTFSQIITDNEDSVYVANNIGELYKFNKNGNQIWKINFGPTLILNLALSQDETALYLTINNKLISLNTQTGSINWDFEFLGNSIYFQKPAISQKDGKIYLLNTSPSDPNLYIFSSATSTPIQTIDLSQYLNNQSTYSSIKIDNQNNNEILYFGSNKQIFIVNLENNELSSKDISEFSCSGGNELKDLNPNFIIGNEIISISQNNFLPFGNGDIVLRTFSKNGEVKWFYCLDEFETSNFSLIDENNNVIFTTTKLNYQNNSLLSRIISFTKDKEINWQILSDELEFNLITSQPIISDNLILLTTKEFNQNKIINKIIALKNNL